MNKQIDKTNNEVDFTKDAKTVAKELIGKIFSYKGVSGVIIETEAFEKAADGRNETCLYAKPGEIIYMNFRGNRFLNIGTESEKKPSCVMIRGISIDDSVFDGPGKVSDVLDTDNKLEHALIDKKYVISGQTAKSTYDNVINGARNSLGKYIIKK